MKKTHTPWGVSMDWFRGENFVVRQFILNESNRTSLHLHENMGSFWFVEAGNGELTLEEQTYLIGPGDSIYIDREQIHRLTAMVGDMRIFEVQSGKIDDDDVIRFEDDYGRTSKGVD